MSNPDRSRPEPAGRWLRVLGSIIACLAIMAMAVVAVIVINRTEPIAEKSDSSRRSAALVDTVQVERGTYSPRLVVLGTVRAAQDIMLSPRVGGQVMQVSPAMVPGGMVRAGDLLLRLDSADFENALSISRSELAQAEASREIEQARQGLAAKELRLLEGTIDESNRALVMREPQIASIEAEVSAAEAAVERATLDLERTRVYAPFDAQVLSRSVNVGSQVNAGDELGRLVGLEEYWIMAAVPVRSLRWIRFAESASVDGARDPRMTSSSATPSAAGSPVTLRNTEIWGPDVQRTARVARMIGTLDSQTRLARVLIVVDDPLGLESSAPPLILDSLIETEIEGRPIDNVVRLRRDFVRDQDTVWVVSDNTLEIRQASVVFRDVDYAYIRDGLESGDQVVTTTLATVADGISLRISKPTFDEFSASEQNSADESISAGPSDDSWAAPAMDIDPEATGSHPRAEAAE